MCVCVCLSIRSPLKEPFKESVCVCVCVCLNVRSPLKEPFKESVCVCVCVCVSKYKVTFEGAFQGERERESVCV